MKANTLLSVQTQRACSWGDNLSLSSGRPPPPPPPPCCLLSEPLTSSAPEPLRDHYRFSLVPPTSMFSSLLHRLHWRPPDRLPGLVPTSPRALLVSIRPVEVRAAGGSCVTVSPAADARLSCKCTHREKTQHRCFY